MGSLRRGLILALLPGASWAEVCDKERPGWDGVPVSMLGETLTLLMTPGALVLLVATALVIRLRHQNGGLIVVLGWTGLLTLLTMVDTDGLRASAMTEGCIGSPALFIGLVIAICAGIVLYTAPLKGPKTDTES